MTHLHQKISALIDGELSPGARMRALAHARSCQQCRREIVETLEVKQRVTRLAPIEVSADLVHVVSSLTRPMAVTGRATRFMRVRRVVVGIGSVSAAVVALAYVVGAPQATQARLVSPPVEEFAAEFADSTGLAPLSDPAVGGLGAELGPGDFRIASSVARLPQELPLASGGPTKSRRAPESTSTEAPDESAAVAWLRRAVAAPGRVGFEGARVISSFSTAGVESFRLQVSHVPGQGTRFDVLSEDGQIGAESFVDETGTPADGLREDPVELLSTAYDLAVDGVGRVDGRRCTTISASRDGEVRARYWIDDATGLLLRRTLYVERRLVRWSGYTSIEMRPDGFMEHLPPELHASAYSALSTSVAAALDDKGWTCPAWLTDHYHLSLLHQVDGRAGVVHAAYTDGVSTISVFEERGSLDSSSLSGFSEIQVGGHPIYVKSGLPMTAVWESHGIVFTAVTDAPAQLAERLVASLPHDDTEHSGGVTTRIGTGLSRLASALTP